MSKRLCTTGLSSSKWIVTITTKRGVWLPSVPSGQGCAAYLSSISAPAARFRSGDGARTGVYVSVQEGLLGG